MYIYIYMYTYVYIYIPVLVADKWANLHTKILHTLFLSRASLGAPRVWGEATQ